MTDSDWQEVAFYIGRRRMDIAKIADAKLMPNQCPGNSPLGDLSAKPLWNRLLGQQCNERIAFSIRQRRGHDGRPGTQPEIEVEPSGFPGAEEVLRPADREAGGRVFLGVDTGAVYSIDAESIGCVLLKSLIKRTPGSVRTATKPIGAVKGKGAAKYGVYFGDIRANVYMLDANTGKEIWKVKVAAQKTILSPRLPGAPTLYEDRLYVPVSSQEERTAGWSTVYPCCTFRGSVVALDTANGHTIWKTYPVQDAPKATTKNSNGVQQYGPNGGAVWNAPTVDPKNHAILHRHGRFLHQTRLQQYRRHHGAWIYEDGQSHAGRSSGH